MEILTFDQALNECKNSGKHLLLGNGFSIACKPNIFKYTALFENADFASASEKLRKAFDILDTTDFEEVILALKKTAKLSFLYTDDAKLKETLNNDAECLKEILVKTIANNHPEAVYTIKEEQYRRTKLFLSHFNNIYTLNYDLLLYWTLRQGFKDIQYSDDDGFRTPEEETDYVTWEVENTTRQNIFYLHGALHLFDAGSTIKKYTWKNTGIHLITQIRDAINKNYFPIIVAEGTSEKKLEAINHSNYLSRAYRSFASLGKVLFIHGHSLADNDDHIIKLIPKTKIKTVYVGIYGDYTKPSNTKIIEKANSLPLLRTNEKTSLIIKYYDSSTVELW